MKTKGPTGNDCELSASKEIFRDTSTHSELSSFGETRCGVYVWVILFSYRLVAISVRPSEVFRTISLRCDGTTLGISAQRPPQ